MGIRSRVSALALLAAAGGSSLHAQITNTYVYNELTSLAAPGADYYNYPLLSRSANRIVFTQTASGTTTLWAINPDGTGLKQLDSESTTPENYHYMSITDDGTKALIWCGDKILVVNTDGTGALTLITVDSNFGISQARITGDGTKVIFSNDTDDNLTISGSTPLAAGVYSLNPDGTGLKAVVTETSLANYLGLMEGNIRGVGGLGGMDVSTDGSHIVFRTTFAFSGEYLMAVNGDGSGLHTIIGPITSLFTTGISGDGSTIWYNGVFVSLAPSEIGVIPFAGGMRTALVTTGLGNDGGGIATDLQLTTDGSKLLVGDDGTGRLYNTDGSGVVPLFVTTQGLNGPVIQSTGYLALTMNATGTQFAFTEPARGVFPTVDEIGFLTINPASTGVAPVITNPEATPPYIVINGGSTSTVSATVTAPTAVGAVSVALLIPGSVSTVSLNNYILSAGANNSYSGGFQGGYDGKTGARTLRIQAETTDANKLRHGTAIDVVPFYIDATAPASQTITFGALSNVNQGAAPFTITATASSGLTVTFTSTTPSICTVSGTKVTVVAVGTCSITASQAGSASFQPAASVTQSFKVNGVQAAQTITFGALGSVTLVTPPFMIGATASSGLPVSFVSLTAGVCSISGSTVTILSTGTCSITASQAGNASFLAAVSVTQSFTVNSGNVYVYNEITSLAAPGADYYNYPLLSRSANRIVFTQTASGATTLWAINPDGTGLKQLDSESTTPDNYHFMSISDDGSKALIWSTNKILIVNTDGTNPRTLITVDGNFGISQARITGDGAKVIFANSADDNLTISGSTPLAEGVYSLNPDGTGLKAIVTETSLANYLGLMAGNIRGIGGLGGMDVSTDGSHIVFRTTFAFSGEYLMAVNGDGSGLHTIIGPITSLFTTGISGDGSTIWYNGVFVSLAPSEIGVIPFAGGMRTALVTTGLGNDGGGIATDLQLTTDGSKLLVGDDGTGRLYNTDGSGVVPLFVTTQGLNGPLIQVTGYMALTMNATGTQFAFTEPARGVFPTVDEIGLLTINPALIGVMPALVNPLAVAPVITNPEANPPYILINGGSSSTVSATVTAPTAVGAVSVALLIPGSVSTVGLNNYILGAGANNSYSGGFQGGYDGKTGARIPRVQAETTDAKNLRHGTAIDFGPFYIDASAPASQTITFGALSDVTTDAAPFAITATASSGLTVSFTSTTASVCTVSGNTVTIVTVGVCSITASQAGSATLAAASITQSFTVRAPGGNGPVITPSGITPVYSSSTTIQPGSWISIYGSDLAAAPATWTGNFPTNLGGVTVTINGKNAYLWYVSPTQINLQAPDDNTTGVVGVTVTNTNGSWTSTVTLGPVGPSFSVLDGKHVAGIILRSDNSGAYGNGAYDIIGPTGNSLGYKTVAAKEGDVVELFGVGFGPTSPVVLAGQLFSGAASTTNPVKLTIGSTPVTPSFAGLTSAGLYQINLTIPAGLGTGDVSLVASVGGAQTPSQVVISLQ